jgi:hypothetical protein
LLFFDLSSFDGKYHEMFELRPHMGSGCPPGRNGLTYIWQNYRYIYQFLLSVRHAGQRSGWTAIGEQRRFQAERAGNGLLRLRLTVGWSFTIGRPELSSFMLTGRFYMTQRN